MDTINIMLDDGAILPSRAHEEDAGLDLYTPKRLRVWAHSYATVDTGVHVEIPKGYAGFLKSKSGLNVHKNIVSDGTIDAGYTGSILVKLYNHGDVTQTIEKGQKITQLVIVPVETPKIQVVQDFKKTARGSNGFGSTGD